MSRAATLRPDYEARARREAADGAEELWVSCVKALALAVAASVGCSWTLCGTWRRSSAGNSISGWRSLGSIGCLGLGSAFACVLIALVVLATLSETTPRRMRRITSRHRARGRIDSESACLALGYTDGLVAHLAAGIALAALAVAVVPHAPVLAHALAAPGSPRGTFALWVLLLTRATIAVRRSSTELLTLTAFYRRQVTANLAIAPPPPACWTPSRPDRHEASEPGVSMRMTCRSPVCCSRSAAEHRS